MAASVLFDAPGPKTVARHRVYAIISIIMLTGMLAAVIWLLYRKGQFAYALWEPFVTPSIVNLLVKALGQTLSAAVVAIVGAFVFGLIFGAGKLSEHRLLQWPSWTVVEFFRAVPLLMLIIGVWFYIGPEPGMKAYWALVTGLILYNGAVFAEIFRAGINAVPKGQAEAAYAIGMRKSAVMRIILIPQAIKIMLPALISQAIVALKDTSLGYAILAPGLVSQGKIISGTFRNVIPTGLVIAAIFIALNLLLTWFATLAQKKFAGEHKIEVTAVGVLTDRETGSSQTTGTGGF